MMFHEFQAEIFIVLFQTKRNVQLGLFPFFKNGLDLLSNSLRNARFHSACSTHLYIEWR